MFSSVTESETADIISYYLQVEGSGLIAIHENAQTLGSLLSFEPVDILYHNIWYIAIPKHNILCLLFMPETRYPPAVMFRTSTTHQTKSRLPKRASGI